MTLEPWLALITAVLQLSGACLFLASAIGMWRLPDLATKLHAPTKAASLGIALFAGGLALHRLDPRWILESLLLVLFVFMTVPVGSQLILRAARRAAHRETSKAASSPPSSDPRTGAGPHPGSRPAPGAPGAVRP